MRRGFVLKCAAFAASWLDIVMALHLPPQMVASQLKILIAVGTPIIRVAAAKYALVSAHTAVNAAEPARTAALMNAVPRPHRDTIGPKVSCASARTCASCPHQAPACTNAAVPRGWRLAGVKGCHFVIPTPQELIHMHNAAAL